MRRNQAGLASFQTLSVLALVALTGLASFGALGSGFRSAIAVDASGAAEVTAGPAVQAGLVSALADAASLADEASSARRVVAAAEDLGTNPLARRGIEVDWHLVRPGHVDVAVDEAMARATRLLDEAGKWRFRHSYSNTVVPIAEAIDEIHFVNGALSHLTSVLDDVALEEAFARVQPRVAEFMDGIFRREDVRHSLFKYLNSKQAAELDPARAQYLQSLKQSFGRADRVPEHIRTRALEIESELTQLQIEFDRNVAAAQRDFDVVVTDPALLEGMTEKGLEVLRASAAEVGKDGFRFTLANGGVGFALYRAPNAKLREIVWRAYHSMGGADANANRRVVNRILALRRELAQVYGIPSYADMAVYGRMVGSAEDAQKFLIDLAEKTAPAAAQDLAELKALRMKLEGVDDIQPWDYGYFDNIRRQVLLGDIDTRAYLTVDDTLEGAFKVAERLFGVRTEEITLPTWHGDVRSFRVVDEDGRLLGNLQMDLFARDGKRSGAWQMEIHQGEGVQPSLGVMVTNFQKPKGEAAARLSIEEAATLFHEFGHALHLLFSDVEVRSLGGNRVTRDFVELPSQLMENWVWEREALDMFARHAETGERMSPEFYEKLLAYRRYGAANEQMHNLGLSFMDLALHRQWDPAKHGDAVDFAREVMQMFSPTQLPEDYAQVLTFRHIMSGGYAAGYYGYKWAEVLEADAFSRFRAEGVLSREPGSALRSTILSKGRSRSAADLFREFMGRAPSPEALLRRLGLIEDAPSRPSNVVPFPAKRGAETAEDFADAA